MTQTLEAYFDGKVIVPKKPLELPAGTPLQVRIEVAQERQSQKRKGSRKIVGLGQFRSGISDLGSNKQHLKGFGA